MSGECNVVFSEQTEGGSHGTPKKVVLSGSWLYTRARIVTSEDVVTLKVSEKMGHRFTPLQTGV